MCNHLATVNTLQIHALLSLRLIYGSKLARPSTVASALMKQQPCRGTGRLVEGQPSRMGSWRQIWRWFDANGSDSLMDKGINNAWIDGWEHGFEDGKKAAYAKLREFSHNHPHLQDEDDEERGRRSQSGARRSPSKGSPSKRRKKNNASHTFTQAQEFMVDADTLQRPIFSVKLDDGQWKAYPQPIQEKLRESWDVIKPKPVRYEWDAHDRTQLQNKQQVCLLYTSPSPRDLSTSRMPSSA